MSMDPQGLGAGEGASVTPRDQSAPESLWEKLLALFLGHDDPEREKKRLLKQITKSLNKSRLKFYKPRGESALPGMARFFFEIYKVVGPAQNLLQHAKNSNTLRTIVIEHFMTEEQKQTRDVFSEERIREQADNTDTRQLAARLKDAMIGFFGSFDSKVVREINALYNQLLGFLNFVNFDYYFVLKKFDASIGEHDYSYKPKFDTINADYITDDLKDFMEVFLLIEKSADWEAVFDVLHVYKGVDVVARPAFRKLLSLLEEIRRSDVLTLIVQHAEKDPLFQPSIAVPRERIVETYLNKLKTTTEATIQKILNERRNHKVEQLLKQIYGTTVITRTKHYTDSANLVFTKRMMAGFTHTQALNYLKAFLLDYFKKDVREVVRDLLLVRGKWTANMQSQQLSEAFHQVLSISEQVVAFDDSLAEEGELGMKLKKASGRVVDKDPATTKLLRQALAEVNETAVNMINSAASNLISIAKNLKLLLDDLGKQNPELILNWKELDSAADHRLKEKFVENYKQIYYFVQLMQMFVKK